MKNKNRSNLQFIREVFGLQVFRGTVIRCRLPSVLYRTPPKKIGRVSGSSGEYLKVYFLGKRRPAWVHYKYCEIADGEDEQAGIDDYMRWREETRMEVMGA